MSNSPRPDPTARAAAFAALVSLLTGCSGASSAPSPALPIASPAAQRSAASVAFTMHWTSAPAAAYRHRNDIPSTARSVAVAVNGATPQFLNNPSTTLTIAAPAGVDTFAFATYDEQNGEGNVLSAASITQTVVAGSSNVVAATLNGVIASLAIALANAALPAGAAATTNVTVSALDADGNVIVGPGDYDTPIHLAVDDPNNSGTLSLSTSLLQTPGTPANVTLTYTGGTLASGLPGAPVTTVVASANGVAPASVAFEPTPTVYHIEELTNASAPNYDASISGITAGPDGNMWIADDTNDAIHKVTPAGADTSYPLGDAGFEPAGIIAASDGNLWYTEDPTASSSPGKIGYATPSGALGTFSTVGSLPQGLVDGGDGEIYYCDNTSGIGYQPIGGSAGGEVTDTNVGNGQSYSASIAKGSDNAIYFPARSASTYLVGKLEAPVNTNTTPSNLTLPGNAYEGGFVRGPDGNVWIADFGTSTIDVISTKTFSLAASYPTPTGNAAPYGIVAGQDGALWFTERTRIGRVTTGGTMSEFGSQSTLDYPTVIAVAPDGSLWFGSRGDGEIEKLVY